MERLPHPTDGRTTLVRLTELGRSTVEDATETLNKYVFADIGISTDESRSHATGSRAAPLQTERVQTRRVRRQYNQNGSRQASCGAGIKEMASGKAIAEA